MPATSACTFRRLVVLTGVVLTVAACGGGSGSPTVPAVPPPFADVDLSGVTPGYTAPAAGTFGIAQACRRIAVTSRSLCAAAVRLPVTVRRRYGHREGGTVTAHGLPA